MSFSAAKTAIVVTIQRRRNALTRRTYSGADFFEDLFCKTRERSSKSAPYACQSKITKKQIRGDLQACENCEIREIREIRNQARCRQSPRAEREAPLGQNGSRASGGVRAPGRLMIMPPRSGLGSGSK
jgi:hypothetical protein